ncbi:hypothetical protein CICLE_v10018148mg [Citrus x clementina]|uniref:Uncharacterized protein n=1 Tax=Citrus clementina TaxID=85681 RepID=V4UKE2_CITCL|nr:hypothetical protein CICLE_v10018148mg [Citrus x clementina]
MEPNFTVTGNEKVPIRIRFNFSARIFSLFVSPCLQYIQIHHIFMDRFGAFAIIFFVVFASSVPSLEARKLLNTETIDSSSKKVSSLFANLVLSALPKGRVPASSPSKKTHGAALDNEKLFARHLAGIDRILQSVPSPGIGH